MLKHQFENLENKNIDHTKDIAYTLWSCSMYSLVATGLGCDLSTWVDGLGSCKLLMSLSLFRGMVRTTEPLTIFSPFGLSESHAHSLGHSK